MSIPQLNSRREEPLNKHGGSTHKKTYAEVVNQPEHKPQANYDAVVGKRQYQKITIETYMAESGVEDKTTEGREEPEVSVSADMEHKHKKSSEGKQSPAPSKESDLNPGGESESGPEYTISGALKQPLSKSHSLDHHHGNSRESPRGKTKISPRGMTPPPLVGGGGVGVASHCRPVNLDLEEAKSMAAKSQSLLPHPQSLTYFSGNPSVEATEGILHFYKENDSAKNEPTPPTPLDDSSVERSLLMCMLAVPATLTSHDLLNFVAPVTDWLEHIQVIRDATPNQYMVLLKFRTQKDADSFYKSYNAKPFNSLESDLCHLVYVARVEVVKSSNGAALPIPGATELPVCPVCLERMDESVNGILTILCNHSFHTSCLVRWEDNTCPVCRYTQTPEAVADNRCSECGSMESLWICLICGYVGCGRYVEGHAYTHFQETNHTYSMQLGYNRVWDYAGDNYVHRLVQNKSDGKMVAVSNQGEGLVEDEEKLDSITLEYTYLLNTQLESQRHYFENKMQQLEYDAQEQLSEAETSSQQTRDKCKKLEAELVSAEKERQALDRKCTQLSTKFSKTLRDLAEEREMNKCLGDNQQLWQDKVDTLDRKLTDRDKEIRELQEQLRDVMFYLEAGNKLAATTELSQEEIQEGQVTVVQTPSPLGRKARKKGK